MARHYLSSADVRKQRSLNSITRGIGAASGRPVPKRRRMPAVGGGGGAAPVETEPNFRGLITGQLSAAFMRLDDRYEMGTGQAIKLVENSPSSNIWDAGPTVDVFNPYTKAIGTSGPGKALIALFDSEGVLINTDCEEIDYS